MVKNTVCKKIPEKKLKSKSIKIVPGLCIKLNLISKTSLILEILGKKLIQALYYQEVVLIKLGNRHSKVLENKSSNPFSLL